MAPGFPAHLPPGFLSLFMTVGKALDSNSCEGMRLAPVLKWPNKGLRSKRCKCSTHRALQCLFVAVVVVLCSVFAANSRVQWQETLPSTTLGHGTVMEKANNVSTFDQKPSISSSLDQTNVVEDLTSVDYSACCGLGHRLVRMACAYHLAKNVLTADLRTFWGWCSNDNHNDVNEPHTNITVREVFSSLFRPPDKVSHHVDTTNQRYRFLNEVPGYKSLIRNASKATATNSTCPCRRHRDKIASDFEFYSGLIHRYRDQHVIFDYMQNHHFNNYTVLGLHVRAGNGEGGDFVRKDRSVTQQEPVEWVKRVSELLLGFMIKNQEERRLPPPLLYVATDTAIYVDYFRKALQGIMPVVDFAQERAETGVFFGETGKIANREATSLDQCLQRWKDALTDMMLLSHTDIVIAGRPSSFVQTMPMSMAFGRKEFERSSHLKTRTEDVYCEVVGMDRAEKLQCYASYDEWCCQANGWLSSEYVRFPVDSKHPSFYNALPRPMDRSSCRPRPGGRTKKFCLPHDWRIHGYS